MIHVSLGILTWLLSTSVAQPNVPPPDSSLTVDEAFAAIISGPVMGCTWDCQPGGICTEQGHRILSESGGEGGPNDGYVGESTPHGGCLGEDCSIHDCEAEEQDAALVSEPPRLAWSTFEDVRVALLEGDLNSIRQLIDAHPASLYINVERSALQMVGCGGKVVAHVPLSEEVLLDL